LFFKISSSAEEKMRKPIAPAEAKEKVIPEAKAAFSTTTEEDGKTTKRVKIVTTKKDKNHFGSSSVNVKKANKKEKWRSTSQFRSASFMDMVFIFLGDKWIKFASNLFFPN
jgi:hypothetical protein